MAALSWRARWQRWRDALLTSAVFQRRAAANPFTRPIARRRARQLFDLMAGFVYSQVLLACVRLRLFDRLAREPATAARLSGELAMPEASVERLLAAAAAIGLLERRDGGAYGLGPLGAPMVDNPAIASMVEHHATLYADLQDPLALLRGGGGGAAMGSYWPYAAVGGAPKTLTPEQVAEYSGLMSASLPLVAEQVLAAYPFHRHRQLLDVGGGEGRFVAALAAQVPGLGLSMFDLPAVAERARSALAGLGLGERVQVHGGSFFDDPLPQGSDIVSLVRVMFDHPDEHALRILQAVHAALPPGGTVVLAEPMSGVAGAEAMGDAYFGFYLLAMGRGRPRSRADFTRLLTQAGFDAVHEWPTHLPLQTGVISAQRC